MYIRDTGIGIRQEDLPQIFEWGYTGCNGHMQSQSTGIGLNLCKRVLTMLGHTIAIRSQPGCGTTVEIGLARQVLFAGSPQELVADENVRRLYLGESFTL